MHRYRKKSVDVLLVLLSIFLMVGIFSFVQLQRGHGLLNIGLGAYEENILILTFCVLSMMRIVYELFHIESHKDFEQRVSQK